jgi:acetyl esterase
MPHPDNSGWMSMLAGKPVTPTRYTSVEEVVAGRSSNRARPPAPDRRLAALHECVVLRDAPRLTAEIYVPLGSGPFPVLVYMHGGGWARRAAVDARVPATRLAEQGFVVVNIDYRLAPEQPFPCAVADTVYAARWAATRGRDYGGDGRVLLGGESAGGNLAAAAIVYLKGGAQHDLEDAGDAETEVDVVGAVLLYGIYDFPLLVTEPGSNWGTVEWMWNVAYLGPHFLSRHRDPLVSPVFAENLGAFPPTYIAVGDEDSPLGQSLSLTRALASHNVPLTLSVVQGCDHAFVYLTDQLPNAELEMERIVAWMRATTASPVTA